MMLNTTRFFAGFTLWMVVITSAQSADKAKKMTDAKKIAYAMSAGPAEIAKNATIMDMDTMPGKQLRAGTNGWISIGERVHRAPYITVREGDSEQVLRQTMAGTGFDHEIAEVARCLRAGEIESPLAPLDDTVAILEVLDEARAQLCVHYPSDQG